MSTQLNLARTPNTSAVMPTATQTSNYNATFTADKAINGLITDFTHTLNTDATPAWTLDLKRASTIYRVEIRNRGDGCCQSRLRDIYVDLLNSSNAVIWTSPLMNPANALAGPAWLSVDVAANNGNAPVTGAQYVRIRRIQSGVGVDDESRVLAMGEVYVLGHEQAGYKLTNPVTDCRRPCKTSMQAPSSACLSRSKLRQTFVG